MTPPAPEPEATSCTRCGASCSVGVVTFIAAGQEQGGPPSFSLCPDCLARLDAFLKRTRFPTGPGRVVPLCGFESPRDLFEKLKQDAALLDDEVTSGRFFNFVITAYHVIDWIKSGPLVPESVKRSVEVLRGDLWIKVCGDLANAGKHRILVTRTPITERAESQQGSGVGRFGKGGFGIGEEEIVVTLEDGSTIDCLDFSEKVMRTWEDFFQAHNL